MENKVLSSIDQLIGYFGVTGAVIPVIVTGTAAYTTGTVLRMCFTYFGWVGVNPFLQDRYARPKNQLRKLKDAVRLKFEGQQIAPLTPSTTPHLKCRTPRRSTMDSAHAS